MEFGGIEIKVTNPNVLDTVGTKVEEDDIIYLFNGNQDQKKWSVERVVKGENGILYSVFPKHLGPVLTDLTTTPTNWIVVLKNKDGMTIFHTDEIQYNLK